MSNVACLVRGKQPARRTNAVKQNSYMQRTQQTTWHTALAEIFVISAVAILCLAAIAKVISVLGDTRILDATDPVFGVSYRNVMLVTGVVELATAMSVLFYLKGNWRFYCLLWLACLFGAYRLSLYLLGASTPCSCLGTIGSSLGIPGNLVQRLADWMFYYLLAGSLAAVMCRTKSSSNQKLVQETN